MKITQHVPRSLSQYVLLLSAVVRHNSDSLSFALVFFVEESFSNRILYRWRVRARRNARVNETITDVVTRLLNDF